MWNYFRFIIRIFQIEFLMRGEKPIFSNLQSVWISSHFSYRRKNNVLKAKGNPIKRFSARSVLANTKWRHVCRMFTTWTCKYLELWISFSFFFFVFCAPRLIAKPMWSVDIMQHVCHFPIEFPSDDCTATAVDYAFNTHFPFHEKQILQC